MMDHYRVSKIRDKVRFREHDDREALDFFCELLRQDTRRS
jgi:hypothetical protein